MLAYNVLAMSLTENKTPCLFISFFFFFSRRTACLFFMTDESRMHDFFFLIFSFFSLVRAVITVLSASVHCCAALCSVVELPLPFRVLPTERLAVAKNFVHLYLQISFKTRENK